MFKRFFAGLVLAFFGFSAHAGIVTLTNFSINWNTGLTPEAGGTATVLYDLDNNFTWNKSFQVNVASFITSINDTSQGVENWITPVSGSDMTFDSIDLSAILEETRSIYKTSIGIGGLFGSGIQTYDGGILFTSDSASWSVTQKDSPSTNIPEPSSIALLSIGMIGGLATTRRKQKKI